MLKLFRNKYFWLVALLVVVALITIGATSTPRDNLTMVEKMLHELYTPLQSGVAKFRDNGVGWSNIFSEKKSLLKRIQILEGKNQKMALENQALREYKAEALRLQKLLDFKNRNLDTYDMVPAGIIARSPSNWYKTIIIDRGTVHGIKKGMPVINAEGLVGRITSVSQESSQVSLITDREMAVGVILQRTRETNGIVEGQGNSNSLCMNNIPYYSVIKKYDKVVTSGLSTTYPKGIEVGFIRNIEREPNGLLLTAEVQPVVNFDKLEEVFVVTGYRAPAGESGALE